MNCDLRRLMRAGFGFTTLLVAGCGGSVSESPSEPVGSDDFAAAWASAVCTAEAPCCAASQIAYDQASCEQAATASYRARLQRYEDAFTRYDAAAAKTCINAWVEQAQSCTRSPAAINQLFATCALMLKGTQPDGAACNGEVDCADTESTCVGKPGQGVCTQDNYPLAHGVPGAACSTTCTQSPCYVLWPERPPPDPFSTACYSEDGLACGAAGVCAAPAQLGAACAPRGCAPGAFCEAGQCVPQRDSGPCDNTEVACSSKSYCASGQCQPKQPDGSACTDADACLGQCDLPVVVAPEADGGSASALSGVCTEVSFASPRGCAGEL